MRTIIIFACLLLSLSAIAQIDCNDDQRKIGLRQGQRFVAPCDSMVVLTAPAFRRMAVERQQLERQVELMEQTTGILEDMQQTQDSLLLVYQDQILSFENYSQTTDRSVQELQANLEQSIANTEEAVKIARRNKVLGILLGGAAGLAGGIIIGGIAF